MSGAPETSPPVIETARLRLRPHRPADLDAMAALWSDPAVTRHIAPAPFDREAVWARLLRYAGHWSLMGYGFLAVEERASGRYAGEVGVAEFERGIEPRLDAPEAGWVMAPWCHGRGYATEALAAILAWTDQARGFPSILCIIAPANAASIAVARKAGFVPEGDGATATAARSIFRRLTPSATAPAGR
jgi:RimJ/RimL family protein N-acetyltransferase